MISWKLPFDKEEIAVLVGDDVILPSFLRHVVNLGNHNPALFSVPSANEKRIKYPQAERNP